MGRLPYVWGATDAEVTAPYPCDQLSGPRSVRAIRAVDVDASAESTFAWVCQLRRAPYSYDLIDNFGRRSPRTLDPAMLDLELGQRAATIFRIVDVVDGRSITMQVTDRRLVRLIGAVTCSYVVRPAGQGRSRLIGVIDIPDRARFLRRLRMDLIMWGDLVMMRKQLRTLAKLAARG